MTEAKFAISFDFTTIRGDSFEEFRNNLVEVFGENDARSLLATAFTNLRNHYIGAPDTRAAVAEVTSTLGATPAANTTAAAPAGSPDPGPCIHGPRKYVPAGVSKTTQRPYPAFWACQAPQGAAKCRS